jgi:hypothetical protein
MSSTQSGGVALSRAPSAKVHCSGGQDHDDRTTTAPTITRRRCGESPSGTACNSGIAGWRFFFRLSFGWLAASTRPPIAELIDFSGDCLRRFGSAPASRTCAHFGSVAFIRSGSLGGLRRSRRSARRRRPDHGHRIEHTRRCLMVPSDDVNDRFRQVPLPGKPQSASTWSTPKWVRSSWMRSPAARRPRP